MNKPTNPDTPFVTPTLNLTARDTLTPGTRLRCSFEVFAGIIPGQAMPELTRRWLITSEAWEGENQMTDEQFKAAHPDGRSTFLEFRDAAHDYAKELTDPRTLNWVRVDFVWM